MGYAFISYSTKNQTFADAIRELFRKEEIDTWMAPYDIPAGSKYAAVITNAIRNCACFVLLLSKDSQASEAVDSEVELAALTFKRSIITVQLEDVVLNDSFTFYIHNKQIIAVHSINEASPACRQIVSAVKVYTGNHTTAPKKVADGQMDKSAVDTQESVSTDILEAHALASAYQIGRGREKNPAKAVEYYRFAAEKGYAPSQYCLGVCYFFGEGVVLNFTEAVKWFHKAAAQGMDSAQYSLGICYFNGFGVEKDLKQCIMWYQEAAEQGHIGAQFALGECYSKQMPPTTAHAEEALKWYKMAAENGHAEAQISVGLIYFLGMGVEEDILEAIEWFQMAAKQGNASAKQYLDALEEML